MRRSCDDVELVIQPGDFIAIAGPNGSGKTTLFRTILGFLPLLSGSLTRSCSLSEFGYVPQSAASGRELSGYRGRSRRDGRLRAA